MPSVLFFLNYSECCASVFFGSIHFTEVLYSVPSVHIPIIANVLQPEILSSVHADRSLNSLIPSTLHTTYACLPCQGKTFQESFFPILFTFIPDWFSFPHSFFLCTHPLLQGYNTHVSNKIERSLDWQI